jgi:hypothetical protein
MLWLFPFLLLPLPHCPVITYKRKPGQNKAKEKVGSALSSFSEKMDTETNSLSCFLTRVVGKQGISGCWRASQMERVQVQQIFTGTYWVPGTLWQTAYSTLGTLRASLSLPRTPGIGAHCLHSSERGTETQGIKWSAQDRLPEFYPEKGQCFEQFKCDFFVWF